MALIATITQRWHTRPIETYARLAHLAVGLWFLTTPLLFQYLRNQEATFSTWVGGGLLVALALSGLLTLSQWEEWLSLPVAGFLGWSAVKGGFAILTDAVAIHYGVAFVTVLLAAVSLWLRLRGRTSAVTTDTMTAAPMPSAAE